MLLLVANTCLTDICDILFPASFYYLTIYRIRTLHTWRSE